jgi:predicted site-specific integrase-resolvase
MGYARVSTRDQELRLQLDALAQRGCQLEHIFADTASGATARRQGLEACLAVFVLPVIARRSEWGSTPGRWSTAATPCR